VRFDLATIDKGLEDVKQRLKKYGEIITYLPTGETTSADFMELDLLLASSYPLGELEQDLADLHVAIQQVPRRALSRNAPAFPALPALSGSIPATSSSAQVSLSVEGRQESGQLAAPAGSMRSVSQTVRVDIRRLDNLMNIVGELAIVRGGLGRLAERLRAEGLRQNAAELLRLHREFERKLTEMQTGILDVRMVPLAQVFARLGRLVRQISRNLDKQIRTVITGAETEIDKLLVEELSDPLMHMIRNAIDHGIEPTEHRTKVGKPATGTIALNAYQQGNHVMLEVEDDGRGVDVKALVRKATQLGKISAEQAEGLSSEEMLALMFLPGISTQDEAGALSGRGVGMDIVKTNIGRFGGTIDVHSEDGIGTRITITLPITLAIVNSLIVRVVDHTFAVPLASVSEALAHDGAGLRAIDGREVMTLRGTTLPIVRLDRFFSLRRTSPIPRRQYVVVTVLGSRRLGLLVDQLLGQQDVVIKPLGKSLGQVRGFAGATELGGKAVGLVLDTAGIITEVLATSDIEAREVRASHG
jgi:two-component system chemotaxis sensor kinase CheA